ncbi:hypothetical protein [uncultured Acetatifactor sp.]|nr:hypothetical protein [uncultured Acetatifactor sp.]
MPRVDAGSGKKAVTGRGMCREGSSVGWTEREMRREGEAVGG